MATEHTPRPGAHWETELVRVERIVPDNAPEPRPNRAARRATARTEDERFTDAAIQEYLRTADEPRRILAAVINLPDISTYRAAPNQPADGPSPTR